MRNGILIALILIFVAPAFCFAQRDWKDIKGNTYRGDYAGVVGSTVELDNNGRIIKIPFADLSKADQDYVREIAAAEGVQLPGGGTGGSANGGNSGTANQNKGGNTTPSKGGPASSAPKSGSFNGGNTNQSIPASNALLIESRTWTDTAGRQIKGIYRSYSDDKVAVELDNGSTKEIPMTSLSSTDQVYVRRVVDYMKNLPDHTWTDTSNSQFKGRFIQLRQGQIWILKSGTDERIEIATQSLSETDQGYVCNLLDGRSGAPALEGETYRVWKLDTNIFGVGRLQEVGDDYILLAQESELIKVNLDMLSQEDKDHIAKYNNKNEEENKNPGPAEGGGWNTIGGEMMMVHPAAIFAFAGVFLVLVGWIVIKYVSESLQPDPDDDFDY